MLVPQPQKIPPFLALWKAYNVPQLLVPSTSPDEINIYGPLLDGEWADILTEFWESDYHTSEVDFQQALQATTAEHVILNINSPGGFSFIGAAIRTLILKERTQGRTFEGRILGMAASAAAIVAVSCDKLLMGDMADFMIHRPSVGYYYAGYGSVDDLQLAINALQSDVQGLKSLNDAQVELFQAKSGLERDTIRDYLKEERHFNANAAIEAGFVDQIVPSLTQSTGQSPEVFLPENYRITAAGGLHIPRAGATPKDDSATRRLTELKRIADQANKPPPAQEESITMHEATIRQLLGLGPEVEVTKEHTDQAITIMLRQRGNTNAEAGALSEEIKQLKQQMLTDRASNLLDKHVTRGALTVARRDELLGQINTAENGQATLDTIDGLLTDIQDEAVLGTETIGTTKVPKGADATTKAARDKQLAEAFTASLKLKIDAGMETGQALLTTEKELGEEATRAYNFTTL